MARYDTQVREVINRNTVVSLALAQGFNAFIPVYDGGIDFILYREKDGCIRKVQLKSRWTIAKKYIDKDIWIAFPIKDTWYLIPHETMMAWATADGKTLLTEEWRNNKVYHKGKPSKTLIAQCVHYRFGQFAEVASAAAQDL